MPDLHVTPTRLMVPRRRREVIRLCAHAVREDAHCIGWLPWQFYEEHDERGTLLTLVRDGDVVGFAAIDPRPQWQTVHVLQIWVRRDARMIEHGRALMRRIRCVALRHACQAVRLWCAEDLEANEFWRQIGCTFEGSRLGRGTVLAPDRSKVLRHHFAWAIAANDKGQHDGAQRRPAVNDGYLAAVERAAADQAAACPRGID